MTKRSSRQVPRCMPIQRARVQRRTTFLTSGRFLRVERLEERCLLAVGVAPDANGDVHAHSQGLVDKLHFPPLRQLVSDIRFKTAEATGSPLEIAVQYLTDNAAALGLAS